MQIETPIQHHGGSATPMPAKNKRSAYLPSLGRKANETTESGDDFPAPSGLSLLTWIGLALLGLFFCVATVGFSALFTRIIVKDYRSVPSSTTLEKQAVILADGGLDFLEPAICRAGLSQSPINIIGVPTPGSSDSEVPRPPAASAYGGIQFQTETWNRDVPISYTQTYHGPRVDFPLNGSNVVLTMVNNVQLQLLQFHGHTPSEHTLDGRYYDAEIHFVHVRRGSNPPELHVFGVFVEVQPDAEPHPQFQQLLDASEDLQIGETFNSNFVMNPFNLLPAPRSQGRPYVRYSGSLTTPPCSEGVHWHVLIDPIIISPEQMLQYLQRAGTAKEGSKYRYFINNRATQKLNGRPVYYEAFSEADYAPEDELVLQNGAESEAPKSSGSFLTSTLLRSRKVAGVMAEAVNLMA